MDDESTGSADAVGRYLHAVREEARDAREYYYQTGECIPLERVPFLHTTWLAANAAVLYAEHMGKVASALPKRFRWLGAEYLLIFPPEGPVLIADPVSRENLCVGMPWWVDPMKVAPAPKT